MYRLLLISILTSLCFFVAAQDNFLVFKKRNKTITSYYTGSSISFQLKNKEWFKGIITKVTNDSFSLKKQIIRYSLMGNDTVHFSGYNYAISDVYAMPNQGIQIDYINNRFQISGSGGHVHWYWIKSGWIFRAGAIGYASLNLINGLIKRNFSLAGSHLGIAAAVFLGGVILHQTYKPALRLRNKYQLVSIIGQ